jgi:hypothetical protein
MPQDDQRTDKDHGRQQRGGARSEQMRGENTAAAEAMSTRMAEIGANSFNAGLRMQTEMFDTLQTIGHQWMERRTCEADSICRTGSSGRARCPMPLPPIRNGSASGLPCAMRTAGALSPTDRRSSQLVCAASPTFHLVLRVEAPRSAGCIAPNLKDRERDAGAHVDRAPRQGSAGHRSRCPRSRDAAAAWPSYAVHHTRNERKNTALGSTGQGWKERPCDVSNY